MAFRAISRRRWVTLFAGTLLPACGLCGCFDTTDVASPKPKPPQGPTTSLEYPGGVQTPDIPVAGQNEVDLVEQMTFHRTMYARLLGVMASYYAEQGYPHKAAWAQTELNGLRRVKTYRYIMDAEVPKTDLKPTTSISEADKLFEDGMKLLFKGGRGFPDFYNQATMRQALVKFKELIDKYPNSDKIAEAAYYIAEIHKEYEKEHDNDLAIEWYKRAIQWDPNTPHPCRFRIATTYDYRLHERELALYWYQKTIDEEAKFDSMGGDFTLNLKYAKKRIAELTPEEHLRAPGDTVADGRPTPSGSPPPAPAPGTEEPAPAAPGTKQ